MLDKNVEFGTRATVKTARVDNGAIPKLFFLCLCIYHKHKFVICVCDRGRRILRSGHLHSLRMGWRNLPMLRGLEELFLQLCSFWFWQEGVDYATRVKPYRLGVAHISMLKALEIRNFSF